MASNDFVENAIASNVDESAVSELASSLENSISNPGVLGHPGGGPAGMTTVHKLAVSCTLHVPLRSARHLCTRFLLRKLQQ